LPPPLISTFVCFKKVGFVSKNCYKVGAAAGAAGDGSKSASKFFPGARAPLKLLLVV
jgi:hypothetical protein